MFTVVACGALTVDVPTWHGFSPAQRRAFTAGFWQQRPLVVRGLLSAEELENFCSLTPADVLDLSCEPAAVSRLVRESGGESPWELRHGPFDHSELPELDETTGDVGSAASLWTVLVNQVDRAVPEVEALRDRVADFVPRWRVDDVMVSYAKAGCSIGAHVDNYDVILLQGRGSRSWSFELSGRSCADEVLVEGASVRVLTHFSPEAAVVLQPGDALYLPPRLAHHGVSTSNDCITYSIGFRAPTAAELLRAFGERLAERTPADALLRVPGGVPGGSAVAGGAPAARGLVDGATVARAREILEDAVEVFLADEAALAEWLGCALTAPRRAAGGGGAGGDSGGWGASGGNSLADEIASGESGRLLLRHTEGAVLAYVDAPVRALFLDGARVPVAPDALPHLPLLCDASRVTAEELRAPLSESAGLRALLDELVRRDALYVDVEL